MEELWGYCTKWNKSATRKQTPCDSTYVGCLGQSDSELNGVCWGVGKEGGWGLAELLLSRCRVSVLQSEKALKIYCTTV